jgi:Ca2+/H+ antiporter
MTRIVALIVQKIRREHNSLLDSSDEAEERTEGTDRWSVFKAVGLLLLGTTTAAAFADPLVDAVQSISIATRLPPFLVSFVVLPLAANSIVEPVSSIKCVSKKKKRMASLTFSEVSN